MIQFVSEMPTADRLSHSQIGAVANYVLAVERGAARRRVSDRGR